MTATSIRSSLFVRHIALPQDHGSWVFLFSPLLIGLFAAQNFTIASLILVIAVVSAFLLRQPASIAVKARSGRRSSRDLPIARFWFFLYSFVGLVSLGTLIYLGFGYLLYLAIPGVAVFFWHLYLISRRLERRQMGIEIVATGVLALAAPAAYWVGLGHPDPQGWILFGLVWLQSAASIVYAYLRLEQRKLTAPLSFPTALRIGRRALLYTTFNTVLVTGLAFIGFLPQLLPLPYVLQWVETIWGTLFQPAVGAKPTAIGIRQLVISTLFTVLFILTWNLS
ncbi:MAG: hypothetical protein A2W35_02220 [Chloroflexi bacterium RBG_16_57_11]|nr:MAG: hypothetical protein A2W35_02220 [Chloroflexi bacterium RBG_16_57_11]